MRPLSIIQVCADRGIAPGSTKGAAQHLRGIAAGFAALGHRVRTHTRRKPEGPFPVEVAPLASLDRSTAGAADVVYERYSLGHRTGLDLARAIGARFVFEVNAPLVDEARAHRQGTVGPSDAIIEAELLREADLVITVSSALTAWVHERRAGPTVTVPNGFEPSWFGKPAVGAKAPTLVFLGHPKPWHGADRLPAVLAALALRGARPNLLIIGGGPGAAPILEDARVLGVNDQITITGALPPQDASARLRTASIGLAPYPSQEPFYFCPLKIVDYLAAGLPVVSTAQGDIPELVGDAGIVVAPDDEPAFVEAIAALLADPHQIAALGAVGRERAHRTMTWQAAAASTASAIDALDAGPAVG